MADYIDRQAALDALFHDWDGMVTSVFDVLKAVPSAHDVKKIHYAIWRQRRWMWVQVDGFKCSHCGFETKDENANKWSFCPGCGYDMRWAD